MAFHHGNFNVGDTAKALAWTVKDRATGAILSLVGATNATVYYRASDSATIGELTPTLGGALGSITIKPGDEADLAPDGAGQSIKFGAVWAEFDLLGVHYTVPDGGPDSFTVQKLR